MQFVGIASLVAVQVVLLGACRYGFDWPEPGSLDGILDDGGQPAPIDSGDSGGANGDAGLPTAIDSASGIDAASGCIPPGWQETFRDEFDDTLAAWQVDANAPSGNTDWTVAGGWLVGHSSSSGTDVALATGPMGDGAVVLRMRVIPLDGATGYRAGGPLLRTTSIDFAENLFYVCLLDPGQQTLTLARYDEETRIGSGQGFTLYEEVDTGPADGTYSITMCGQGDVIVCEVPEIGLRLKAIDTRYPQGVPGLRVMRADLEVDQLVVYQP